MVQDYCSLFCKKSLIYICCNASLLLEIHKISKSVGLLRKYVDLEVKYMSDALYGVIIVLESTLGIDLTSKKIGDVR
jgi:hypothetical protein